MNALSISNFTRLILPFLILTAVGASAAAKPLVIAHRGASGYYPEHTLVAYRAAVHMGADYIEPDLVITRDGHLIARHDLHLGHTTNVAEVFPDRQTTLNGKREWYVSDFTLEEIRQLKARQHFPGRTKAFDDIHGIPTLADIVALARELAEETGRRIGIYPELKSPGHFRSRGHDPGELLLESLRTLAVADDESIPVYIQSFDPETLQRLAQRTPFPLIMLLYPKDRESPGEPNIPLDIVAGFADGIGIAKSLAWGDENNRGALVRRAHALGMVVHAWTFRDDQLPDVFTSPEEEIHAYLTLGIDGFFTDYPDTGVSAIDAWQPR